MFKYDCYVNQMYKNQLQYFGEIEVSDRLWGMGHVESPLLCTPNPSSTVSPWLDEPGCSTPTHTPVATVSNQMENLTPSLCLGPKKSES